MKKKIYLSSPHMGGNEEKYIKEAFDSNWITSMGENIDKFEESVKNYVGTKFAVALSSGTAAIHLSLKALGVKEGDYVLCQSLTFAASANPIVYEKSIPIFIDSEINTFNISPRVLKNAIADLKNNNIYPKVLIAVNLYGQSCDYDEIRKICDENNIKIIEDSAESLGGKYKNKMTGNFGDISIFSFNGNKIITTSGGGMAVSNNQKYIDKIRFWSTQSKEAYLHYEHEEIGYNYRMSNIIAGIGRGQMEVLDDRVKKKKWIYDYYKNELSNISEIKMANVPEWSAPNYWLSVAIVDKDSSVKTKNIIESLEESNIESRPIWKPMHLQPVYKNAKYYYEDYDVSKFIFENGICLPSDTKMTEEDLKEIVINIKNIFKGCEKNI